MKYWTILKVEPSDFSPSLPVNPEVYVLMMRSTCIILSSLNELVYQSTYSNKDIYIHFCFKIPPLTFMTLKQDHHNAHLQQGNLHTNSFLLSFIFSIWLVWGKGGGYSEISHGWPSTNSLCNLSSNISKSIHAFFSSLFLFFSSSWKFTLIGWFLQFLISEVTLSV